MKQHLARWSQAIHIIDPIARRKAALLQIWLIGSVISGILGVPISLLAPLSAPQQRLTVAADLLLALIMAGALSILRRGKLKQAILLATCGSLMPLAITYAALGTAIGNSVLVAFTLPITMAGLLADRRGLIFAVVASLFIVIVTSLYGSITVSQPAELPIWVVFCVFVLIIIALGIFLDYFAASLYRAIEHMLARERELEQSRATLERRTQALEREIIERRRIEAALRESEDKFRALVTHSPVGIFQTASNGACLFVNRQWCDLAGLQPEEALGHGWLAALHPADAQFVQIAWEAAISQGQTFAQEYRFITPQGKVSWLFGTAGPLYGQQGDVLGYFGIISDITESKLAREALRASEELYRLITENANDLISLINMNQDMLRVYASPSYERVLGYDPAMLVQHKTVFDLIHSDDVSLIMAQFHELRTTGTGQATYRLQHADGSWRWIETRATAIVRDGERFAVAVGRDITDRKRLEAQFFQAQKMESIGRLAGGIAHDFNNLLTAILGNAEMALDVLPPTHSAHGDVLEIAKAAERAGGLTRQLLAFARKQILEPHVIDLRHLLSEMNSLLRRLIGEDIELATRNPSELWRIKGDPNQIEQVVVNLAVNARDAMPHGGKLLIETANIVLEADFARDHIGVIPGRYVLLAISDTGVGMDDETQRRAFEPFFTTKPQGRGTGLGLATCYGIVKQHGGNIWVYSEPGNGTSFKIYLPVVDELVEPAQATASATDLPRGSETVLLVEDEPTVRTLAARILRNYGYDVIEAAHGRDALGWIECHTGQQIDLLLTDVVMPYMSGKAIAEVVQNHFPTLKVLYISGYTDQAIVHHGRLDPGIAFLHKPFTPAALVRKVRDVLGSG